MVLRNYNPSSYPPCFRNPNPIPISTRTSPSPSNPNQETVTALEIPIVDLQRLDPERLGRVCRNLGGIFRLTNHGVPPSLSSRLHEEAQRMLSLPFEEKENGGFQKPLVYFWGTPAVTSAVKNLNWVEGLHVPLRQLQSQGDADGSSTSLHFARCLINQYGLHMARVARTIFDVLAVDLNLDSSLSASYLSEYDGTLRLYRYPCCLDTSNFMGMDAHTDSSVLSILSQGQVGGLQILHDKKWFNVAPTPETLILILGDIMQAISNDEYKIVEHRVVGNENKERISLCYFGFPYVDSIITSKTYKPFTYNQFKAQVQEDIKATGFKIGLDRFKFIDPI